ncbi:GNAT family N-acetyltransferase [Microbacterium stercoris]|uniref:GNAT family N-acetyltransferase n=1 Tax=Microbacterium stercoris TaxID=2820289 RepID=A0A939QHB8_9MICO|nr:GNAT family protein [Microbacterium stercoris]MBO3662944.1 GNAT family N-acetyltransferase [Microbacterium stercoris]
MDPLDAVVWPVFTERLALRRATAADADSVWQWRKLPEVGEWITRAPTDHHTFVEQFIDPTRLAVTLIVELDGQPIGDLMLKIEDGWTQAEVADQGVATQAELGWVLDPAHQGRGYATEAVRGAIGVCFEQLGLRRVHAGCFAANEPSWRVMERLGMRREEHSRKTGLHRSGVWMDGMNYGLLAEEWQG